MMEDEYDFEVDHDPAVCAARALERDELVVSALNEYPTCGTHGGAGAVVTRYVLVAEYMELESGRRYCALIRHHGTEKWEAIGLIEYMRELLL